MNIKIGSIVLYDVNFETNFSLPNYKVGIVSNISYKLDYEVINSFYGPPFVMFLGQHPEHIYVFGLKRRLEIHEVVKVICE